MPPFLISGDCTERSLRHWRITPSESRSCIKTNAVCATVPSNGPPVVGVPMSISLAPSDRGRRGRNSWERLDLALLIGLHRQRFALAVSRSKRPAALQIGEV